MGGLLRRAMVVAGAGVLVLSAAVGVASAAGGAAGTRLAAGREGSGGTWGTAIKVPGTAALNRGRRAEIASVSCASAGNCSAGGYYRTESGGISQQAFVVSQAHGTWGKAIEVPGTAALNGNGSAAITSVSCASAGNCSAGGYYASGHAAFVVSQANGTWGTAIEVPGTAPTRQVLAAITSVSCVTAGNCSAGGYTASSGHRQAFVVSQANGTWGTAIEVPGTAALNQGGHAAITSVSCAAAGTCSAGGYYTDSSGHGQALVVSQARGTWHRAIEVPGTTALNRGGDAAITSVSCAAAGTCSAGGHYRASNGFPQAFVVSRVHGTWHTAIQLPGTAAPDHGAAITSVSCAAAGNCSAGGQYLGNDSRRQALVVSKAHGTWGTTIEVPGTAALNRGDYAAITSVSCAAAGKCSAGGYYTTGFRDVQAFVVSET